MDKRTQGFATPEDAQELRRPGLEAVAYVYKLPSGKPAAICFGGKRSKPDIHGYFTSDDARTTYINEWFDGLQRRQAMNAQRKRERDEYKHDLAVGDILVHSWGYDQTNVDFYQVVKRTAKTVKLLPIGGTTVPGSEGFMCDKVLAVPNKFLAKELPEDFRGSKRVSPSGSVSTQCGYCHRWNGQPEYRSWYA